MKLVCAPRSAKRTTDGLRIVLFDRKKKKREGALGALIAEEIARLRLAPPAHAWDFLAIALSVLAADLAGRRLSSPDGWTRDFDIDIAVSNPSFWHTQREILQDALAFLTTDRWRLTFSSDGFTPAPPSRTPIYPTSDSVVLLSGGLDSLIGSIDLVANGASPYAVSHLVRGDAENQIKFAAAIGDGLPHFQANHDADIPAPEVPPTQRGRSLAFLAYGVIAATSLELHRRAETVPLYLCENGLIAINPPLTSGRLGSLSTRTAHPRFLRATQAVLSAAGIGVTITNPYGLKTKGEMLAECRDETFLRAHARHSTSCGRFLRHGYKHCGRCIPCQIRRASFVHAGIRDNTGYVYTNLGKTGADYRGFDDVRSAALAIAQVKTQGVMSWLGSSMSWTTAHERAAYVSVAERGLNELAELHSRYNVK
jgi:hypothetical protein